MRLTPSTFTADIQNSFTAEYPLLKIEFYLSSHKEFEGSQPAEEVTQNTKLSELNPSIQEGALYLTPNTSVKELESELEDKFGLHAQVFRRSRDIWLQTSKTDKWTLAKQQQHAEENETPKEIVVN